MRDLDDRAGPDVLGRIALRVEEMVKRVGVSAELERRVDVLHEIGACGGEDLGLWLGERRKVRDARRRREGVRLGLLRRV